MMVLVERIGLCVFLLASAGILFSSLIGKVSYLKKTTQSMCAIMMIIGILFGLHPLSLNVIMYITFRLGWILCFIGILGIIFVSKNTFYSGHNLSKTKRTISRKIYLRFIITGWINIILYFILNGLF